jgi:hypothetical protein
LASYKAQKKRAESRGFYPLSEPQIRTFCDSFVSFNSIKLSGRVIGRIQNPGFSLRELIFSLRVIVFWKDADPGIAEDVRKRLAGLKML